jgi:hypothetical protein
MNPMYNEMGNNNVPDNFMSKFQQFRQNFKGNPQEQVQQLLNSGKVSQADYNRAVQLAQQFQRMFGGRI